MIFKKTVSSVGNMYTEVKKADNSPGNGRQRGEHRNDKTDKPGVPPSKYYNESNS